MYMLSVIFVITNQFAKKKQIRVEVILVPEKTKSKMNTLYFWLKLGKSDKMSRN